ncbi:phospholipase A2-like [Tubulanus polymorphus]|uniref:phospholipase A2-like n=1 Tax=Tubulanus polymorphus TaxID=672921 RepID=UPI003DA39438
MNDFKVIISYIVLTTFSCLILCGKESLARSYKSYVATIKQPFGKVRLYSDGDHVVTAFFDRSDDLIFCHPSENGTETGKTIFAEAIEGKSQRDKMVIKMDVARHAKRCTKFLKGVEVSKSSEKRLHKDKGRFKTAKMMLELYYGVPGTNWCRFERPSNITRKLGEHREVDKCCRRFHRGCPNGTIPGHHRVNGLYNYYPWPLYHCRCTYMLNRCLSQLTGNKLAKHVGELIFNHAQLPCFRLKKSEKCLKWKPWYTKCRQTEDSTEAHRRRAIKHFRMQTRDDTPV